MASFESVLFAPKIISYIRLRIFRESYGYVNMEWKRHQKNKTDYNAPKIFSGIKLEIRHLQWTSNTKS